MLDPYKGVKGGRLAFKGGVLATRNSTDMKKKKKKKHHKNNKDQDDEEVAVSEDVSEQTGEAGGSAEIYTIDAAKRRKYDDLFPVEAKKFGYDPRNSKAKSVEEALDDRVKKKADRYCK